MIYFFQEVVAEGKRNSTQTLIVLYHTGLICKSPKVKVKVVCGLKSMGSPNPLFQALRGVSGVLASPAHLTLTVHGVSLWDDGWRDGKKNE